MNSHEQRTGTRRVFALGIAFLAISVVFVAPANAQDPAEPPLEEVGDDPDGEEETETNQTGSLTFDFGGAIVIDEDGTVRWNIETDTNDAEEIVVEPTPIPVGVSGTGDQGTGRAGGTGTSNSRSLADEATAGAGNSLALIIAFAGAAATVLVGAAFGVRMRRQQQEERDLLEDPIDPLADEALAGEFPDTPVEPAYAGAAEAGAYEKGGAAYAQYAGGQPSVASEAASNELDGANKLDQLRASMVDLADKGLADVGHDRLVALKLEAAGSKMRPGEWLVMTIAGTIGAFFGASFFVGWLIGALAAVLAAVGFWMYLSYKQSVRQKLFAEALPETLQLIAGSLRGGTSMIQSIQTVADEADQPTAEEFQRIITETRMGRDLAVSFRDLSERMGSKDFDWVVTAIEIHREVGGDLASILDRVGDTIRARNRVRGQVKALSAEGRMSGLILFVLPPGMVAAISFLNRDYLNEMLDETSGQIMLIVATVLLLVGGVWLKRLARFVY